MKPFQDQTYYELLEVQNQASMDEIRRAYERAAELYSADSVAMYALENPGVADELRARLREAMEILTDEDLRQEYDRMIGVAPRSAPAEVLRKEAAREEDARDELTDADPDSDVDEGALEERLPPQPGMLEVPPSTETVNSTHGGEVRVAYVDASGPRGGVGELPAEEPSRPALPEAEPANELRAAARPAMRLDAASVMAADSAIADAESAMAQVAAKVRDPDKPRPKPLEIAPDADFNGELLRRCREAKGYTLQQLADRTRIGARHLENIEADRYAQLPVTVYLRGMLLSLAKELGLDGNRVAKSYLTLAKR